MVVALSWSVPAAAAPPAKPPAAAATRTTVLLPAAIAEGGALRAPGAGDADLAAVAQALDALLPDTAQDLGMAVDRGARPAVDPASLGDAELLQKARAAGGILVLPSLRAVAGAPSEVELRLVLADPAARSLHVRSERVARDDVPVRAVVMLRDLAADAGSAAARPAPGPPVGPSPGGVLATPAHSSGRPILLVAATLFGGFAGYSIQRASSSDDPRVLYPLLAVGAGIGLGGSIIASEEWDVGPGEAGYVAAGVVWPTLAGHLLYQGRFAPRTESDRWLFGLVGGTTGLTLSILGLTLHGMSEGGALMAHSGGSFGLVLGGLTEALVKGDIHATPFSGMGYGASLGWMAAAALATQVNVAPTRVLTVDLGALLGGLGGAAAASPLLINDPSPTRQRGWVGATAGSTVLGATIALIASRERAPAPAAPSKPKAEDKPVALGLPSLGVLGESRIGALSAPILGVSLGGVIR
jgi:hypothetical protein